MQLHFDKDSHHVATSVSAAVRVGGDWWIGGDEGTSINCFRSPVPGDTHTPLEQVAAVDLWQALDLPGKADAEVDLEGMDWDQAGGHLWLLGSHSFKRQDAEPDKSTAKNLKRLANITADGNRFLLGRIPLAVDQARSSLLTRENETAGHFSARLGCSLQSSDLTAAIRLDPLFAPFFGATTETTPPGKDNGIDFEGLAWDATRGRLLVGLRGPVLRGSAIILEIECEQHHASGEVGALKLKPIGPEGRPYIRHFLDLDGLSIRDLCFHGEDLLILAGPVLPIDWPITVYLWKNARARSQTDAFWWQQGEPEAEPSQAALKRIIHREPQPPPVRKHDRPEAIAPCGDGRFAIFFDSPSPARFDPQTGLLTSIEIEI
jgi:hypothetical protein